MKSETKFIIKNKTKLQNSSTNKLTLSNVLSNDTHIETNNSRIKAYRLMSPCCTLYAPGTLIVN